MADEYKALSQVLKEADDVDDIFGLDLQGLLGNPSKTIVILLIVLIILLKKKKS